MLEYLKSNRLIPYTTPPPPKVINMLKLSELNKKFFEALNCASTIWSSSVNQEIVTAVSKDTAGGWSFKLRFYFLYINIHNVGEKKNTIFKVYVQCHMCNSFAIHWFV